VRRWTSSRSRTAPSRIAVFFATRTRGPGLPLPGDARWSSAGRLVHPDLAGLRFRVRCVRVAREEGIAAALALGVSRATLHRWRIAYGAGGLDALVDRPRGPVPARLPGWVEQAVIVVRLLTYWNSKRLAAEFTRREIYPLDHHAVDGLLAGLGTARPSIRRERGPAYERGRPNELWHIDIKGPFFLRRSRTEYEKVWIVGLVDDHSRFLIGLRVLPQPRAMPILAWLDDCVELCGTPLELMSDNGTPFVVWMPGVLTLFGKTLEELHIRHLRTQVNSPWTNGKIERFWGSCSRSCSTARSSGRSTQPPTGSPASRPTTTTIGSTASSTGTRRPSDTTERRSPLAALNASRPSATSRAGSRS
jgi:transposase InsO family protein